MVAKFCAMLELEALEERIARCKLVHFDKLKAAELELFIISHHPKYTKLSDVAHLKIQEEVNQWKRHLMVLIVASQWPLGVAI